MYKESLVYYGTSEQNELGRTRCGIACKYNPINNLLISLIPIIPIIIKYKERSSTLEFLVVKLISA
jgi:hypothetical protein